MNLNDILRDDILKPGRYIGREWNVSTKDFAAAQVKVALCFPDLYEVGMSNLGVRILYGILNRMEGVACERCFAPAADLEARLKETATPLFTLESRQPLGVCDIVGFSLGHELCYTNVLAMLELSGIPLRSSDRTAAHPLIIGGGPCVANPEPVHAFFDCFVIGEGEEALPELIEKYRSLQGPFKQGAVPRREVLRSLAQIPGVYVPSLFEAGESVEKRIVCDFENSFFPVQWLVPYLAVIHDRVTVEVMRGCPNRCRFCQARAQYYPVRMRSPEKVLEICRTSQEATGYEEVALAGLSVSDYPHLPTVLGPLIARCRTQGIAVSLPSIKPKALVGELSTLIASIKKTGLTFAPEVGSRKLLHVIGKDFDFIEFYGTLKEAYSAGYQHVKLYFMIGLPHEDDRDLDAIVEVVLKASALRKDAVGKYAQVNVSINTFIPKPHTPLQWCGMCSREEAERKQRYLLDRLKKYRLIKVSFHEYPLTFLEGVFTRGDRRLANAIEEAYRRGARFDAWQEHLKVGVWEEAFAAAGVDAQEYLRERSTDEALPWGFLSMGIDRERLAQEYADSMQVPLNKAVDTQ
jgi:radical SAM family uncharacterized protein